MENADIKKLSAKFFQDRQAQQAIGDLFNTAEAMEELLKNAPAAMKKGLKDLPIVSSLNTKNKSKTKPEKNKAGFV